MSDEGNAKVCEHSICTCQVAENSEYCSLDCEEAHKAGVTEIACECGHSECGAGLR